MNYQVAEVAQNNRTALTKVQPAANILATIGHTPLVELKTIAADSGVRLLAKLDGFNPGGSSKDRPALSCLRSALEAGLVHADTVVVESSSGNMGIGMAQACRYFGLRFICVVDPRTAPQNIRLMKVYGAEIDYVSSPDPATGEFLQARINRVQALLEIHEDSYWPNQYANAANAGAHYFTTVREIVEALDGRLDYLFCPTSTCGTIRGCADYLKENGYRTRVVAVDAVGSLIFSERRGRRLIPGLGAGLRPPLCEPSLIDEVVHVTDVDCITGCRRLVEDEAILVGGSSGGVLSAMVRTLPRMPEGSVCVGIFPDRGERYLDTVYDDAWVRENFGDVAELCAR